MPKSFLIMQRGANIGTIYNLKNGHTSVGRNSDNDIMLDEVAVSRYHATLQFDEKTGDITVMDLGSTNGITVNNNEIKSGVPYKLQQRDTLFIGRAIFNVQIKPDNQVEVSVASRVQDPDVTGHLNLAALHQGSTKKLTANEPL